MAQKTITANATASLTAQGQTTATGSITWTAPTLPEGVSSWDSIVISGTWFWNGKGSISRVTINGTNTSNGVAFNININGKTSPLSITCVGNKNATGANFRWSNLIVTYTYTEVVTDNFWVGVNGTAVPIKKVWRAVNGQLQEVDPSMLDRNANYVLKS